ncbi:outer membrane protein assembly factor BamA [Aliamphritea spongicola]|uniref:outer membrane protein assembly factor BamA n=1 Tax=Aliamphritea spongicola TaxID=707589 RepID=UPI00196A47F9|nr:outer membrane protein assembly factor BamA [Aliamphritea spongicola]MBN3564141.1 outer membrane protein assembly factor BamA [Aliamphritea spongicola]
MKRRFGVLFSLALFAFGAQAETFTVEDIRLEGIQRVEPGVALRYFAIDSGEQVDSAELASATRRLFKTGYFEDIQLERDGNVLVLRVKERPAVSLIRLEGNSVIDDEALLAGLEQTGLKEGDVFKRATLDQIRQDLLRLYVGRGRYGADIETEVEPLSGNRVALNINVTEGKVATIQHINIVGNTVFEEEELTDLFSLKLPGFWSFFTKSGRYAREKLSGDLERLRSFYLDRGYVNFNIDSTQVSVSPDKKHIFISINITEGDQYSVSSVDVTGDLVVPKEELMAALTISEGEIFSREKVTTSQTAVERKLGDQGYLFANVSPVPELNEDDKTVALRYFVAPGKRTYVRRINITGNTGTSDEAARRTITQMEGALASSEKIETSKGRIEQTGYFQSVDVETVPVPGTDDQVDLNYVLEEQNSGSLTAGIGFSRTSGLILNLGLRQDNFLGSGKQVGINVEKSDTRKELSFSYLDPYYTVDGVSRGFNFFFRERNFTNSNVSDYLTDEIGARVNFGYPIDDFQRINFSVGAEQVDLKTNGSNTAQEVFDFIEKEGDSYLNFTTSLRWTENKLNRRVFPTRGTYQSAELTVAIPGSDLTYHSERYEYKWYKPLDSVEDWIISARGRLGYAGSLGDNDYPFYRNYFSGGLTSVRGFKTNTLGPRDSQNDAFGGNVQIDGSVELIVPAPFIKDSSSIRTLVFFDIGNVFQTECLAGSTNCDSGIEFDELRYSAGIGFSWLTPVGPLSFALAQPLNSKSGDDEQTFEFALGRTF